MSTTARKSSTVWSVRRRLALDRRIVDEDVDLAGGPEDLVDDGADLRLVRHIANQGSDRPP